MSINFLVSIAIMYMWFVAGCATFARPLNDLLVGHPTNSVVKKTKYAIPSQNQQGINRVIAYASHRLKPAGKSYPVHKLDFLALKWAVSGKFYNLLYGTKLSTYIHSHNSQVGCNWSVVDSNPVKLQF